jgi:hypothetical protein
MSAGAVGPHENLPPDLESERAVLGAALVGDADAARDVAELGGDAFFKHGHRLIAGAVTALLLADGVVDIVLVAGYLRDHDELEAAGGAATLAQLLEEAADRVNVRQYAARVGDLARKRAIIGSAGAAAAGALNGLPADVLRERLIADLERLRPGGTIHGATIAEILAADPVTLQTPYIVPPWVPRGLGAIASKPGVGKTKLIQDLCLARASGGTWLGLPVDPGPALFWSGEQGKREDFRVTQALCRGRGIADPRACPHYFEVIYDPAVRFGHPTMTAYVQARLREHPGLLIGIDSIRRAFEGEENDSSVADAFFRTVLVPLRAAGATVQLLCHPPKPGGPVKVIADENMIRGSGDWIAQLDSFLVLRPVNRERHDPETETITLRLVQAKARGGPESFPLLIALEVTHDLTPWVTFRFVAKGPATDDDAATRAGAVKLLAALAEERKRFSRKEAIEAGAAASFGRPACSQALKTLADLGVIRKVVENVKGERGHWFAFIRPLVSDPGPSDEPPEAEDGPW